MTRLRAGAALAVTAIAAGLAYGTLRPDVSHGHRHVVIQWDGGAPADAECLLVTGLATPAALATFGLQSDAGEQYALVRVCASPTGDGGSEPALPPGMFPLSAADRQEPLGSHPRMEVWLRGADGGVPWACACSTGSGCDVPLEDGGTGPAPLGLTLRAGAWSGSGCVRKVCVQFSGISSWDPRCPTR